MGTAALEWATEREVIHALSGRAEHICREDAVVVAPATLNTINGIIAGLANNPVTTLVASALGARKPVLVAPTMHESLYQNPILQRNLANAHAYGITLIPPRLNEGKAKMPAIDTIAAALSRTLSTHAIKGKRVLVTAGSTPVHIDGIRRITNIFRGTLGRMIATEAYWRGADTLLLISDSGVPTPSYLPTLRHHDYDAYVVNVDAELAKGYDAGVFSAAVADYRPVSVHDGKIPSSGELTSIALEPTAKVITRVRRDHPELYMVTFKYELGVTLEELVGIVTDRTRAGYQLVVANRGEDLNPYRAYLIGSDGTSRVVESKELLARTLVDHLGDALQTTPGGAA